MYCKTIRRKLFFHKHNLYINIYYMLVFLKFGINIILTLAKAQIRI